MCLRVVSSTHSHPSLPCLACVLHRMRDAKTESKVEVDDSNIDNNNNNNVTTLTYKAVQAALLERGWRCPTDSDLMSTTIGACCTTDYRKRCDIVFALEHIFSKLDEEEQNALKGSQCDPNAFKYWLKQKPKDGRRGVHVLVVLVASLKLCTQNKGIKQSPFM